MEGARKKQKEMLAIKNTVTERKDIFDGFIIRLDAAEERISGLGDISVEASKTEKAERARQEKRREGREIPQLNCCPK